MEGLKFFGQTEIIPCLPIEDVLFVRIENGTCLDGGDTENTGGRIGMHQKISNNQINQTA